MEVSGQLTLSEIIPVRIGQEVSEPVPGYSGKDKTLNLLSFEPLTLGLSTHSQPLYRLAYPGINKSNAKYFINFHFTIMCVERKYRDGTHN
jgi:hypothetical protein